MIVLQIPDLIGYYFSCVMHVLWGPEDFMDVWYTLVEMWFDPWSKADFEPLFK